MQKQLKTAAKLGAALCLSFNLVACTTTGSNPAAAQAPDSTGLTRGDTQTQGLALVGSPANDTLRFYNLHTQERATFTRRPGQPVSQEANWFMRDHRRGEPAQIDPKLLDLLGDLQNAIHARYPGLTVEYHVISGYRAPATNNNLRGAGGSQAENSLHTTGQAIDIRVPGLSTRELRDIATCLNRGGVGYYASDDFVHVDTGRVRYWPSRDYLSTLNCGR
ncbi:MAG: YcbK family protein [Alphaproteobacteria bacterium]